MKKFALAAVVSTVALMPMAAEAATVPFTIDLNSLGTITAPDGTEYDFTGVTFPPAPVGEYDVSGASYVEQQFVNGSPNGQSFVDSGFLQLFSLVSPNADTLDNSLAGTESFVGTNDSGTDENFVYFEFVGLTGSVSGDGSSFTFDTDAAQLGTIRLVVDNDPGVTTARNTADDTPRAPAFEGYCLDAACSSVDQSAIVIAEFQLVALSGGSDLVFDGGAFVSGTVGVTLVEGSVLNPGLFLDEFGNPFDQETLLRFIDVDATAFATELLLDLLGNGVGNFNIANNGSLTVMPVPEPLTLGLFAMGLGLIIGASVVTRRRDAA